MYISPSPSSDPHDPFSNSQADPRYYDNDSEHNDYGRRDPYNTDSGSHDGADDDRYYDHHGSYDPYSGMSNLSYSSQRVFTNPFVGQHTPTPTQTSTCTVRSTCRHKSHWGLREWAYPNPPPQPLLTPAPQVHARHILHGARRGIFPCRRKRLRISSWTSHRSSVSSEIQ